MTEIFKKNLWCIHITRVKKLILVMKVTALLFFVSCLHLSATSLSQTINLKAEKKSLAEVLSVIKDQTGFMVVYNNRFVNAVNHISITAKDMPLENFLKEVLKETSLIYVIKEKSILIKKDETSKAANPADSKEFLKQQKTIRGKVVDERGEPLAGVGVNLKGTTTGTVTTAEGTYSIQLPSDNNILIFSYIGFTSQAVEVKDDKFLTVVLLQHVSELKDVVVVGYGSTSQEKITGAISSVSTADFKNRPITDVSMALQGKVTGVQVTQNSGQPGADAGTVTIRGIGTLNDSSPLVIIDGFESSFDKVDPKDIESISVLKDAASASIYGNKAANGVVLITTKKGKNGVAPIEYNTFVANQTVTRYPSLLGSVDFLELYNEARLNSGQQPSYSQAYINSFKRGDNPALYPDRNWADFYFKDALHQNHYLKMSGGKEELAYTLSVGYLGQQGILQGTDYAKYTFRSNVNNSFLNNKLKISVNIAGYRGNQTDLVNGTASTLGRVVQMTPTVNAKIEGYGWTGWFYDDAVKEQGGEQKNLTDNFNSNINIQFQLTNRLKLEGAVNYDRTKANGLVYAPNVVLYTIETGSNGEQTIGENRTRESRIIENFNNYGNLSSYGTLQYVYNTNGHYFKILGGGQQTTWDQKYTATERSRLTANLPTLEVGDPISQKNSSWQSEINTLSLFGRFNYDYKAKYLFEANLRHDGSSRFAKNNKWGTFPSFSLGWRISEDFSLKEKLPWVNELKLRTSWGRLGNEKIWSAYAGTDILAVGNSNYIWDSQSFTGSSVSYIANKDLTWETTTQTNIGIDATLLNNLSFSADFYIKETNDILMQLPVSSTFGFTEVPWVNAGRMKNVGLEISASYVKKLSENLQFNTNGNISFNRNKILSLKGASPILQDARGILLEEGYPINTLYGYEMEGIYQNDEEIHNHLRTFDRFGNPTNSYSGLVAAPGDIRFRDQNGDGIIDMVNDRVNLGDPSPNFLFAFTAGLKYKTFDFTSFFQGLVGGEGWSSGALTSPFFNGYNSAGWLINRWTPERPNNTYQRVYIDSQRANIMSSYYVEDLSYLRLKNIEFGYTFTESLLKNIKIKGARAYISGQNLFTITSYQGFDPERAGVDATNIYSYPLVRTFTAGINITL
jgi:TonB-linked SusC/RagA family outer membrane protein